MSEARTHVMSLPGVELALERRGSGPPLLLLASEEAELDLASPFLEGLGHGRELIIPHAPGFQGSSRPEWIASPDDIAYLYLDMLDALALGPLPVVGLSLGGWIALEMAIKDRRCFSKMALVDPYGVKLGGPFDRDAQDIWTLHPAKVAHLKWSDPEAAKRDFKALPEERLTLIARNLESFARFCWDPYMHDPKLKRRLHRIGAPTLFLWGEDDGVVTPAHGRACSALVPNARFATIAKAAHYPQIEQPQATLRAIEAFLA